MVLPAILEGGNGSLSALVKAAANTFCRICGCKYEAILPKHTVVLVLIPPLKMINDMSIKSDINSKQ